MIVYAVNSEKKELSELKAVLSELCPDADIFCFEDSLTSLASSREKGSPDIAFIRADMPELSGLDLGTYFREMNPFANIIFLADNTDHAYEAIQMRSSGYLLRPVSAQAVGSELKELRYPHMSSARNRVYIQTFGDFEIFVDGEPVSFKYNRTKEVVAVLVNNHGAQTTNGEIIASLWEDEGDPEKKLSYLRNLRQDLQNTFKKLRIEGIIKKQRGSMSLLPDNVECDLYDWLEKKKESKYQYTGDYMNQYSWPEFFHAELDEISYQLYDE